MAHDGATLGRVFSSIRGFMVYGETAVSIEIGSMSGDRDEPD